MQLPLQVFIWPFLWLSDELSLVELWNSKGPYFCVTLHDFKSSNHFLFPLYILM